VSRGDRPAKRDTKVVSIAAADGGVPSLVTVAGYRTNPRIIAASAMMFEDPVSRELVARIRRLAPSEANILIVGETGTGKELAARYIHSLSLRQAGPFVAVNSAALSEGLAEAELFGHERGAYTGAHAASAGWFETANGGTLFLDEIGELALSIQVKLLRVLQEREVIRLGSRRARPIDVRFITATNIDLERAMAAGRFREDLYYRLKVAEVRLPPLRERPSDILPLARHFLAVYGAQLGLPAVLLAPDAVTSLERYPWPGNIRELENVINHALLICQGSVLHQGDLHLPPIGAELEASAKSGDLLEAALGDLLRRAPPNLHREVNDSLVRAAFAHCDRNQVRTARLLGLSRNVLRACLIDLGIIQGDRRRRSKGEKDERSDASATEDDAAASCQP
jgi:sigma-54 dependent transcriptional regulator